MLLPWVVRAIEQLVWSSTLMQTAHVKRHACTRTRTARWCDVDVDVAKRSALVPSVRQWLQVEVDCLPDAWSGWSECDAATGRKERTRHIVTRPSSNGLECPALSEATDCKVACLLGAWSGWGECSASCGSGRHTRRRAVEVPARNGGEQCSSTEEADSCNTEACAKSVRRRRLNSALICAQLRLLTVVPFQDLRRGRRSGRRAMPRGRRGHR